MEWRWKHNAGRSEGASVVIVIVIAESGFRGVSDVEARQLEGGYCRVCRFCAVLLACKGRAPAKEDGKVGPE